MWVVENLLILFVNSNFETEFKKSDCFTFIMEVLTSDDIGFLLV